MSNDGLSDAELALMRADMPEPMFADTGPQKEMLAKQKEYVTGFQVPEWNALYDQIGPQGDQYRSATEMNADRMNQVMGNTRQDFQSRGYDMSSDMASGMSSMTTDEYSRIMRQIDTESRGIGMGVIGSKLGVMSKSGDVDRIEAGMRGLQGEQALLDQTNAWALQNWQMEYPMPADQQESDTAWGSLIGTVGGGVIGSFMGGNTLAGMAIGGALGSVVDYVV